MEVIEKRFEKFQLFSMVVSIFSLIVGSLFLGFEEHLLVDVYKLVIGCIVIIAGLFSLVKYFYDGLANDVYKFEIVNGIALLILGAFMLIGKYEDLYSIIGIFFGIYYLLVGIMKGYYAFRFLKNNEEIYPLFLMMTILIIVMGVLSIFNPFGRFMLITRLMSIFLIVGSILELMSASLFRKRSKYILKIFE